jgi:hypothetical protein
MPRPFTFNKRRRTALNSISAPKPESTSPPELAAQPPALDTNPDHAWKALSLVNEWIRHADAKAGVTLAFTGVLATMLFNLVKDFHSRTMCSDVVVIVSCTLLAFTAGLCAWTLTPRTSDSDTDNLAINRLFYASITKNFKGDRRRYIDVLHTLTADSDELTRDIAHQIHANAEIATTKSRWVKWAIRSAVAAGATVAFLAILIGV